ncbi:hypothetical protein PATSB16_18640 [Pandoraea thiooxydans]|nr:GGDEF domain-containing protein [Pandoraea thiooxydans]ALX34884.2 hypothetical protein ABW99_06900 [Pandoraea thiooxydans]APR95204.1 hypothetical protein PATSB16_18640 [Pandoraea thiooxydans]
MQKKQNLVSELRHGELRHGSEDGAAAPDDAISKSQPCTNNNNRSLAASAIAEGITDSVNLLSAIKSRFESGVAIPLSTALRDAACESRRAAKENMLLCAAMLEQLHDLLLQEKARLRQLESEVCNARAALVAARADLVGTLSEGRRVRHLALHDDLTTLPNRVFFREWLNNALLAHQKQRQTLAVLYLDLDHFKRINDAHGHHVGDELIKIVAARLARTVRIEDIVSRLGGDEFACLFSNVPDRAHLSNLAGKLFEAISAPLVIDGVAFSMRPSIGIAIYPSDGMTSTALLKNADAAMYCAKRRQTGHAFFDQMATTQTRGGA